MFHYTGRNTFIDNGNHNHDISKNRIGSRKNNGKKIKVVDQPRSWKLCRRKQFKKKENVNN